MSLSQEFIEKSKFSIQMCFFRKILVRSLIELETWFFFQNSIQFKFKYFIQQISYNKLIMITYT